MNTNVKKGIVFQAASVKHIIEDATPWLKIKETQDFFVQGVAEEAIPSGTRINTKVTCVKGDIDEEEVFLVFTPIVRDDIDANAFEGNSFAVSVKVEKTESSINEVFELPYIMAGTFCVMDENGQIDILTDEEREFRDAVNDLLGDRNDKYAELIRSKNVKTLDDRELILLHKIKTELKHDDILKTEDITPIELITSYIEYTEMYINAADEKTETLESYANALEKGKESLSDVTDIRKLEKDTKTLENKISILEKKEAYCVDVINKIILPVLA